MKNVVAIDIETTGLYPIPHSKIFCIAVNDGKTINVYENIEEVRDMLENPKIMKVIQNAAFDSFWLRRLHGIEVQNIWDTMLMEQILLGESVSRGSKDEDIKKQSSASLKYTLARYKLADLTKTMGETFSRKNKNAELTKEERDYVMDDVRYLLQLQAIQEYRLMTAGLMRLANLENSLIEVIVSMRNNGIILDKNIWGQIALNNEMEYNSRLKQLPIIVKNWNSPQQVKKYFNDVGIPLMSLSDAEELYEKYPYAVLKSFIEMRSLFKRVTTYGKSWLQDNLKGDTVDGDNRVRADFTQIINTGRFSCSHPNLQQIPKKSEHRSAFVPGEGNIFVVGDFTGQELGIMAAASQEEIWIKAMLRDEDIHSLTASLLYPELWRIGKSPDCLFPAKCKCPKHEDIRHKAKTINFAIAYGAGPLSIGKTLKLSDAAAIKLLEKYKRVVPKLTRWFKTNAAETIKTRESFSADPFKRRRILRDSENWMLSTIGKNNPVQACGANMLKLAMVSMPKNLNIVLIVHDEIILEVSKEDGEKAAETLKVVMEKAAAYCTGITGLIKVSPTIKTSLS